MLPVFVGALLAISVGVSFTGLGMDRDRAFYPVVTIVVASYYVLFAVLGGSTEALLLETLVFAVFLAAAIAGFKWSLWAAAAALAGHGVFDFFHAAIISNPGVPAWWPGFCGAYDVVAAGYLAWLLTSGRGAAVAA